MYNTSMAVDAPNVITSIYSYTTDFYFFFSQYSFFLLFFDHKPRKSKILLKLVMGIKTIGNSIDFFFFPQLQYLYRINLQNLWSKNIKINLSSLSGQSYTESWFTSSEFQLWYVQLILAINTKHTDFLILHIQKAC